MQEDKMEKQANSFESLFERAGEYFETRLDLLKLKSVDKSSDVASSLIGGLTIILIISFAIIIASIGLALWIGERAGKSYYGFFIVAGFYIFIALIGYLLRKRFLKSPIANLFINKVLND